VHVVGGEGKPLPVAEKIAAGNPGGFLQGYPPAHFSPGILSLL